ncbi:S8 family peptidase [Sporosarcina ureae]|uniref:S8 family peptidase n=1 Tax=Sporosarcina ureae TaxID=1571 RepID=UPI0009F3FCFD|nr:S8 family peptidase [Sporosarcina ureae]
MTSYTSLKESRMTKVWQGRKEGRMKKEHHILFIVYFGLLAVFGYKGVVSAEVVSNELLVEYEENRQAFSLDGSLPGVESREPITDEVELWSFTDSEEMLVMKEQLLEDPNVLHVEPNYERYSHIVFNDPILVKQWWIPQVKPQWMWSRAQEQKKTVIVAVIDSGIDLQHEDLQGRIQPGGYNFYANNSNVQDVNGHGTAVAGVVAAKAGNNLGIVGIAGTFDAKILPLKISHLNGLSKVSDSIQAIDYAIKKQVDVINMSYGSSTSSQLEEKAILRAVEAGITVVSSAGNDATKGNLIMYPASYPSVISVGATDRDHQRASFSNYNSHVNLVAPGAAIYTTTLSNGYKSVSGTSFSGPIVAGATALVKSLKPEATPVEVRQLLEVTATDLGAPGKDIYFGAGVVNLEKLSHALPAVSTSIPPNEFKGDFPELNAQPSKVFKIKFTSDLQLGKDYARHIYITRSPNSTERIESFTAKVNFEDHTQLFITPTTDWQPGVHYLRVDQGLQNEKGVAMKKSFAVKFTVSPR